MSDMANPFGIDWNEPIDWDSFLNFLLDNSDDGGQGNSAG